MEGQGAQHAIGRDAESRAADFLLSLGYCLVTRNFRVRGGEIDLICLDGDTLVFVEVKARSSHSYRPEEAIGIEKLEALQRTAWKYMETMSETRNFRFDVIVFESGQLRHHKHIFSH